MTVLYAVHVACVGAVLAVQLVGPLPETISVFVINLCVTFTVSHTPSTYHVDGKDFSEFSSEYEVSH